MRIVLVAFNARYTHSCLGLFHVRNELEHHCPTASLDFLQMTINDQSYEALLRITAARPDYVFFSAAIWNSDLVEKMVCDLLICLPDCRCVVGGPQAAVIASNLGEGACSVVIGPIEDVDPGFYRDLAARNLQPRYSSRLPVKRYRFVSPYREGDFSTHLQNRHIYYETSRGCPFSCTYCLSSTEKGTVHKDLGQVEEELSHILSHRPKVVRFIDRTFNDKPDRALAIWRFLARSNTDTLFHFEISPDRFTEEMFDFLGQLPSGLFQFEIGIQSTNPQTLKVVRRLMHIESARQTVARLAALDTVFLHVDLIMGLPYETEESFYRSFADVFFMAPHYIQMGLLKILPDTPICHTADEFGYLHQPRPPYSILANRWVDHQKLSRLYWFCECVERFVNNRYFLSLWAYLRRRDEDIVAFFLHLLLICHSRSFFTLASTQDLLCATLFAATKEREDAAIIVELLCFDWLRCGHRYLPEYLKTGEEETGSVLKRRLFHLLPESIEGLSSEKGKKYIFKRGIFRIFSEKALVELGYHARKGEGCLCFMPEKEAGLQGLSRVIRLKLAQ